MSELLLVPIHIDALYVGDNGAQLIAPLADFTRIPYACWVSVGRRPHQRMVSEMFNSDDPFTSLNIMRQPAALANLGTNYVAQATGIHLHWSLPDALTVM